MGSYMVYGGSGVVNLAIAEMASEVPISLVETTHLAKSVADTATVAAEHTIPTGTFTSEIAAKLGIDVVTVADGHIYLSGISALDIGSTVVIILTAVATLIRAYYDMSDWRDRRRISKLVLRRAAARSNSNGDREQSNVE